MCSCTQACRIGGADEAIEGLLRLMRQSHTGTCKPTCVMTAPKHHAGVQ